MDDRDGPLIVTIGAAFSANKGASSMLQAVVDNASTVAADARVQVLTTYPVADTRENRNPGVEITSLTPRELVFPTLPLAFLMFVSRLLGGSGRWFARTPALRALLEADVVADLAGISFADGRGFPTLAYNALMTGIPLLVGTPVVKCSQAIGPATGLLTRLAARMVLPHCVRIVARGETTRSHLDHLGLSNVVDGADLAFSMETPASAHAEAIALLEVVDGPFVVVSPSAVVEEYSEKHGLDYVDLMARACDGIVEDLGRTVVVIAHSARPGKPPSRMNDLPVCRAIAAAMRRDDGILLLDQSLDAATLRAVIDRADALITSRFHGMISGLATSTPTLVVGWSHKYAEVMRDFELEEWVVRYQDLDLGALVERTGGLIEQSDVIRKRISSHLPEVRRQSRVSIDELQAVATPAPTDTTSGEQPNDLSAVLASDMCIGCGACVHADPTIELRLDDVKQIFEPSHPGNALAAAVCPAIAVDYAGLQDRRFPGAEQTEYGVVKSVMLAQSTDHDRNLGASSGGLIKEIMIDLLSLPEVDGVIALSEVRGLEYEPRLVDDPSDVDSLPGSIYHNLPKHRVLELLENNDGKFVLVGIPCEFEGIFQYIYTAAPELEAKIHSTIGLLCGWQYSHHSLRAMAEYRGLDFDAIEHVSYRGGGPVGKLRIETPEKDIATSRRVDFGYQVAFDRTFNTPRCHLCINHSNFLADIVVGDAWLPSTVTTRTGISLIVNRTDGADALLRDLESRGRIVLSDVTTEEIKESQKPRVVFGDFAYAYADYRRELGLHTPQLLGPNQQAATPAPRREVEHFHSELVTKLALQRERRYRRLYWRKATRELPRFAGRYWEWFAVRILRIKSIKGERQELSRAQVARFK